MFTPHEPPPRARDIGRIPFPRLTPWAGPGGQDSVLLATPSPLQISTPVTPGHPAQQGADARPARQASVPQIMAPLVMWSSKISGQSGHNQRQTSPTLESLPRPSTGLQRSREEKPRQTPGQWGFAQMQSAEVWSPGLPRAARADPALTKLPAGRSDASFRESAPSEERRLDSGDMANASREDHPKVLKDEHTPRTLSRLSRPSGASGAGLGGSGLAARDGRQPGVVESPRFSVLRAHLQGLALRQPEPDGSSSGGGGAKGAGWRPMQSSVPRPQRPAGSGRLQVQSPASGPTAVSPQASAVASAAVVKDTEQPRGGLSSQHDSAVSALLKKASNLAVSPAWEQKQGSLNDSSMGPPVTKPSATSSANKEFPPRYGSGLWSGEGLASPSSTGEGAQHQPGGLRWRAGDPGLPARPDGPAEKRQPLHRSDAPQDGEGSRKMGELLASMHDLTGSHVLPVLAAHVNAAPPPVPRVQHRSAPGHSISEQLGALRALQQEGAQAISDSQSTHPEQKSAYRTAQLSLDGTGAARLQSSTSFGQVTMSGQKARQVLSHDRLNRPERTAPLDADGSAEPTSERAVGRGVSKELLSQLQRLQALQREAQLLLT